MPVPHSSAAGSRRHGPHLHTSAPHVHTSTPPHLHASTPPRLHTNTSSHRRWQTLRRSWRRLQRRATTCSNAPLSWRRRWGGPAGPACGCPPFLAAAPLSAAVVLVKVSIRAVQSSVALTVRKLASPRSAGPNHLHYVATPHAPLQLESVISFSQQEQRQLANQAHILSSQLEIAMNEVTAAQGAYAQVRRPLCPRCAGPCCACRPLPSLLAARVGLIWAAWGNVWVVGRPCEPCWWREMPAGWSTPEWLHGDIEACLYVFCLDAAGCSPEAHRPAGEGVGKDTGGKLGGTEQCGRCFVHRACLLS